MEPIGESGVKVITEPPRVGPLEVDDSTIHHEDELALEPTDIGRPLARSDQFLVAYARESSGDTGVCVISILLHNT
jgi:hypothetical protein